MVAVEGAGLLVRDSARLSVSLSLVLIISIELFLWQPEAEAPLVGKIDSASVFEDTWRRLCNSVCVHAGGVHSSGFISVAASYVAQCS